MRKNLVPEDSMRIVFYALLSISLALLLLAKPLPVAAAPNDASNVNSTGDESDDNPGDHSCHTVLGTCTLRAAIQESNAYPGTAIVGFDFESFAKIQPQSPLPDITGEMTLRSSSISCGSPLCVEVNGALAGTADGFHVTSDNVNIQGLIITGWSNAGINLESNNNMVLGNFIGVDKFGTGAAGNGHYGIRIAGDDNQIGGNLNGEPNVISANSTANILIASGEANFLPGNNIGTNVDGTAVLGTNGNGVEVTGASFSTSIGGVGPNEGNLISGNVYGIYIHGGSLSGVEIEGNRIGTNADQSAALPNQDGVVAIDTWAPTIGGGTAAESNVISGNNAYGILIRNSHGAVILSNHIGTDTKNKRHLGNGTAGIYVSQGSIETQIGSTTSADSNAIMFNGKGVVVGENLADASNGIRILRNAIYANHTIGIDLADDGVTPNGSGNGSSGPNLLENFPVISQASAAAKMISGKLSSTPNQTFIIYLYSSPTCDSNKHGEGKKFLKFVQVTTNGSGVAKFHTSKPLSAGSFITAVAVSFDNNSSEFSKCRQVK